MPPPTATARGLCRLRRRQLREPVRHFPLFARGRRAACRAFGRELAKHRESDVALRTLPNNVLGHIGIKHGLKGSNACITNHSVGGTLAVIEAFEALRQRRGRPRGRRGARNADRAADAALLPPPRIARDTNAAPVRRAPRRQPVRRRRRRTGPRDRRLGGGAQRTGARRNSRRGYACEAQGRRDPRRRRWARACDRPGVGRRTLRPPTSG